MSSNNKIQENLDSYLHFYIRYNLGDKKQKDEMSTTLKQINSLKLSKFKPKINLKSTYLENIFPDLKTNLLLNFEKIKVRIEKDSISIEFPKDKLPFLPEPKLLPRFISKSSFFKTAEEHPKILVKELKEIDEALKLYFVQKFFEIKKEIALESIEIMSFIKCSKEIKLKALNNIFNENIESHKNYKIPNIEIDVKEGDNIYTLSLENNSKEIFSIVLLKENINWTKETLEILNENVIKLKDILEELKT
jgi:hypothetical protein